MNASKLLEIIESVSVDKVFSQRIKHQREKRAFGKIKDNDKTDKEIEELMKKEAEDRHLKVISQLKELIEEEKREKMDVKDDEKLVKLNMVGLKRTHSEAFRALKKNEMNNVELAFTKRPFSPRGFCIYSDK